MTEYTTEQKAEAFAAADRYFKELESDTLTPEPLRGVVRKPNPLFGIFYADGYLKGRRIREEERLGATSEIRVAALMVVKAWDKATPEDRKDPGYVRIWRAVTPGIACLRAALKRHYEAGAREREDAATHWTPGALEDAESRQGARAAARKREG